MCNAQIMEEPRQRKEKVKVEEFHLFSQNSALQTDLQINKMEGSSMISNTRRGVSDSIYVSFCLIANFAIII